MQLKPNERIWSIGGESYQIVMQENQSYPTTPELFREAMIDTLERIIAESSEEEIEAAQVTLELAPESTRTFLPPVKSPGFFRDLINGATISGCDRIDEWRRDVEELLENREYWQEYRGEEAREAAEEMCLEAMIYMLVIAS